MRFLVCLIRSRHFLFLGRLHRGEFLAHVVGLCLDRFIDLVPLGAPVLIELF